MIARFEKFAHRLPPPLARTAKRFGVHVRYAQQARRCREGYEEHGRLYPHPVLFIAGLPKSGTTWLKKMVSAYPGFDEILIPDVAAHELATGGSHDYDLPADTFARLERMLAVMKMHVHGSQSNVQLLAAHRIPHVVLYRDLRDVAVSHYFYVRQTPWHPEYPTYRALDVTAALRAFAARTLGPFTEWIVTWRERMDPTLGLIIRYEDLVDRPGDTLSAVGRHFGLDRAGVDANEIADAYSFDRLAGGRARGQENTASFFRSGIAGGWRRYFNDELEALYEPHIDRVRLTEKL